LLAFALLATLAAAMAPGTADAQSPRESGAAKPPELRLSVAVGQALPLGKAAERWAAGINEAARGGFLAKPYPGATLAGRDPARELLALADGRADLAVGSALEWSAQVPALAVFALPWFAPSRRDLEALAADAALRAALSARLDAAGVVMVALAPLGHRAIATAERPIRGPGDLAGLRLRAAPSPLLQETLAALGAAPQSIPFAQAKAAFANGGLDGQEGPFTALVASRASAFVPTHVTDWGAFADVMVFAVRKPVWEGWSAAERDAAARAAEVAVRAADAPAAEARALDDLARHGAAVLRLTPAGHEAFRAAVRVVDERWRQAIGTEIVEIAERARPTGRGLDPRRIN
jgi:TRAP-type C4-dicarboxylate transport system substrate-binding protein